MILEPQKPPEPRSDLSIWGDKFRVTNLPTWLVVGILVVLVAAGAIWGAVKIGLVHTGDKVLIPKSQAIQFDLLSRHDGETPLKEAVLRDESGHRDVCQLFASDGAVKVIRRNSSAASVIFVPEPVAAPLVVASAVTLAAPAYAEGQCYPTPASHPGQPERRDEALADGSARSWRAWSDGCAGFYYFYPNGGAVADPNDPNGKPLFTWTHCVH